MRVRSRSGFLSASRSPRSPGSSRGSRGPLQGPSVRLITQRTFISPWSRRGASLCSCRNRAIWRRLIWVECAESPELARLRAIFLEKSHGPTTGRFGQRDARTNSQERTSHCTRPSNVRRANPDPVGNRSRTAPIAGSGRKAVKRFLPRYRCKAQLGSRRRCQTIARDVPTFRVDTGAADRLRSSSTSSPSMRPVRCAPTC
jgi:hypothetical protein